MPVIDIHDHVTPQVFRDAIQERGEWFGLRPDVGELHIPKFSSPPEDRMAEMAEMDEMGVDIHCLTINTGFFQYGLDAQVTKVHSCKYMEETRRFPIDMVGASQVVLGTDYPAPMILDDAVNWINGLENLTADEKEAILSKNPARMLGI